MIDIVERLRAEQQRHTGDYMTDSHIYGEAADEIARLRAENTRLRRDLEDPAPF